MSVPTPIRTPRRRGLPALGAALGVTVVAGLATFGSASIGAASPSQSGCGAPILDLANPSAGDVLSAGDYFVSGTARDPGANAGDGIDRVDLFVGPRDQGGTIVGSGVPQQGVFVVDAKLPSSTTGGVQFVAYAHSAVTGQETVVSVPVYLGAAPTPTPHTGTMPAATPAAPAAQSAALADCAAPAAAGATSSSGAVSAPAVVMAASSPAVLQLANPHAGDTLLLGDDVISGLAYVPNASAGPGVDRVEFFLGDRDSGGTFLGSAVPGQSGELGASPGSLLAQGGFAVKVTVPSSLNHQQTTFVAYARNASTGQETVVSVPVSVGAPPTPTPRPS